MKKFVLFTLLLGLSLQAFAQLEIYPAPPSFSVGDRFAVTVNSNISPVFKINKAREGSYAETTRFGFDSTVVINITTTADFSVGEVRPLSYGIVPQKISSNLWRFNLPADYAKSKVVFVGEQTNGNIEELIIIGNPPSEPVPTGAIEYANGLHVATDSIFTLSANTTYYLHPGAVLQGNMFAENQDNITIMGNGIVKGIEGAINPKKPDKEAHTIETRSCNNLTVKGITFAENNNGGGWHTQTYRGTSLLQNLTIDHVTTLRSSYQSDGIGIGAYQNVSITNCYFRSGDHPVVVGWVSELRDVLFENCVLQPVFKGHSNIYFQGAPSFQNGPGNGILNNIKFKDCHNPDVVVSLIDANFYEFESMQNIVFENVTVDDPLNITQHGANAIRKLLNHVPSFPSEYKFVNLQLPSVFTGGSNVTAPNHVTLENSTLDGTPITVPSQLDWQWLADDGRLTIVNGATDTIAPSVPANLVVSGETSSGFTLSWDASTDNIAVASYDVYIDGIYEGNTLNTTYSFNGLDSETTYALQVLSKDTAGNLSALSSAENGTTLTSAACSTIVSTTASSSNGSDTPANMLDGDYNTRWISQVGTGSEWATFEFECETILEAVNMVFFRSNERTYTFDIAVSTDGTSFTTVETGLVSAITPSIPNATDFQTFTLTNPVNATHVRIIGYGNSVNDWNNYSEIAFTQSDIASTDTESPTAPSGISESNVTSSGFDITWTASTDNVGVTGYEVFLDGVSQGTTTSATYNFNGLIANTTYTITVNAFDAAGNTSNLSTGYTVITLNAIDCTAIIASTASATYQSNTPNLMLDGAYNTRWITQVGAGSSEWVDFEFDCENTVTAVKLVFYRSNERTYTFDIAASTDGISYTTIESGLVSAITTSVPTGTDFQMFTLTNPVNAKHIRIIGYGNSANNWNNYSEIDFDFDQGSSSKAITKTKEAIVENEIDGLESIIVYPNPAQNYIQISGINKAVDIAIYDVKGRFVKQKVIQPLEVLDTSNLSRGIYILSITNSIDTNTTYKKIVIK